LTNGYLHNPEKNAFNKQTIAVCLCATVR